MHVIGRRRTRLLACLAAPLAVLLLSSGVSPAADPTDTGQEGDAAASRDWPTWQKDLSGSRSNRAERRITPANVGDLQLRWAFTHPRPNDPNLAGMLTARSQPAIVGGIAYFGSTDGKFYAVDAKTGATRWSFDLGTVDPDTGIAVVRDSPAVANGKIFFGDYRGYLYALDQKTGKLAWNARIDTHPAAVVTSSPIVFGGRVYVGVSSGDNAGGPETACCTFRGHIDALDVDTGALVWRHHTVPEPQQVGTWPSGAARFEPSGGGVWSSPVIDPATRTLYVGTGQNYTGKEGETDTVLALDATTGAVRWKRQMTFPDVWRTLCADPTQPPGYCPGASEGANLDYDFGAMPNLFTANGRKLVGIGQKSGVYHVFDARTGEVVWQRQLGKAWPNGGVGGVQWGASYDGHRLYVATWFADPGSLFALDPATGRTLWETKHPANGCSTGGAAGHPDVCALANTPAVTTSPGVVYEGSADGKMRAYSAENGRVLWEFDTIRDFQGVNGLPGHGQGISGGGGAVVADGVLYVNSGYFGQFGKFYPTDKGSVLLAFSLR
ncbi:polyvinyl alcohol dehydrogenase (cytochrome) [Streptoalloteichus tenebrarius]|uniref:Polyvinyl alcohol dehydrogenase (Cytochrome) n=1 Tax=Streptoalloteichus tenebrarius (strain ATCC 17920 / DSM 40477 / JCM 4838 / CBS 697.72 / NBRC 16177 / NCIMB 11028 / NRRL B-12390 / A12253. 1 / ISP 5477) TaxID=1933 RepID=A0ABT1HQK4_STRSD|nr:PQQ-binding-like beta-propeller repeat protein [Streptoalloteichus tenebrarius]MCP2257790.1 polyvinyl alcohol dehydrogenase (cytochrome) [Streptoalloteichus tenebrarius]BFE99850.1 PQQ-binding-like beta-propeller repeat protein [Streptoalloteichus tenebrarius]